MSYKYESLYCTRVRNGPLAKNAPVERWFSEPVNGVRGEHQHNHHEQEYGYGALEVHSDDGLTFFLGEKIIWLKT